MGRSAASIQAEITTLETFLQSSESLLQNVGSDGTSAGRVDRAATAKRLDLLYAQLGRANGTSPMITRGVVLGLR